MKPLKRDWRNGMDNTQIPEWKQNLSRHQTLDSLYFVNYSKQKFKDDIKQAFI